MNNKNEETSENTFILNKSKILYTLNLELIDNSIYIKCSSFQLKLDKGNLSEMFSIYFTDIKAEFNFLLNLFINNRIEIHDIVDNSHIILAIKDFKELNKNNKNNIIGWRCGAGGRQPNRCDWKYEVRSPQGAKKMMMRNKNCLIWTEVPKM